MSKTPSINKFYWIFAITALTVAGPVLAQTSESISDEEIVACTQEAKLCPDGSYVGRTGPNCEFAPCPSEIKSVSAFGVVGERFIVDDSRSTDDGVISSYSWQQVSGPFKFETKEGRTLSVVPPVTGTYVFELVSKEGEGERVEKRVHYTVGASSSPDTPEGMDSETEVIESGNTRTVTPGGGRLAPSQPRIILYPPSSGDGAPTSPIILEGIDIDFHDLDSDDDGLDDGTELTASNSGAVSVDGVVVRGWDQETKDAVRDRLDNATDINNANDFGLFVAMQAIEHEEIQNIRVEKDIASITFETQLKLIGFIPVKVVAESAAQSSEEVKTSYPWWSFLARKSQSEKIGVFSDIAISLATREGRF